MVTRDVSHFASQLVVCVPSIDSVAIYRCAYVPHLEIIRQQYCKSRGEEDGDVVDKIPCFEVERAVVAAETVLEVEACMLGGFQEDDASVLDA